MPMLGPKSGWPGAAGSESTLQPRWRRCGSTRGASEIARQSGINLPGAAGSFAWMRSIRFNWEAVENSWNQWVLSYSQDRQRDLVGLLGLAPSAESLALLLAVVVTIVLAAMGSLALRTRKQRDPLGDAFRLLRDRLDRAGVVTAEHLGPRALYKRSKRALVPEDAKRARKLLSRRRTHAVFTRIGGGAEGRHQNAAAGYPRLSSARH